jgi:hypothetical protein
MSTGGSLRAMFGDFGSQSRDQAQSRRGVSLPNRIVARLARNSLSPITTVLGHRQNKRDLRHKHSTMR